MTDKFPRLYAFSQQEIDVYMDIDQDLRDLFSQRDSLRDDLKAAQAIIVDAGQQVADLKAENAELRKDIEGLRKIVKAATEYVNGHFYAEPQWRLNRLFEDMCTAMDTPQPKEDKQS